MRSRQHHPSKNLPRSGQRGAAIITAMLVVTLATVVVAGLFWREHVTIRSVENRLAMAQTNWIERVVLDWARVALRLDGAANRVDTLHEYWAERINPTRLDETVTGGAQIGDAARSASLMGQVFDAQARLNLNNLLATNTDEKMRKAALAAFRKLLELNNLPTSLADVLQAYLARTVPLTASDGKVVAATELPLLRVTDLRNLREFDQSIVNTLRDQVVFLPKPTAVNLNTAGPLVIAAMIPEISREDATRFCNRARREFATVQTGLDAIKTGIAPLPAGVMSIDTGFFLVSGVVRYDRVEAQSETLIQREVTKVSIIWQQRS